MRKTSVKRWNYMRSKTHPTLKKDKCTLTKWIAKNHSRALTFMEAKLLSLKAMKKTCLPFRIYLTLEYYQLPQAIIQNRLASKAFVAINLSIKTLAILLRRTLMIRIHTLKMIAPETVDTKEEIQWYHNWWMQANISHLTWIVVSMQKLRTIRKQMYHRYLI